MNVAPYVFYCVGCHIHVLIRADASWKERGSDARTPPGPRMRADDLAYIG
jgi:hypothetical protein